MATHKSALKEHRASQRRRDVNRKNLTMMRGEIKKLRQLAAAGDASAAEKMLPRTYAVLDRSIRKGVIKENAGNRHKARLSKLVNTTRARTSKA